MEVSDYYPGNLNAALKAALAWMLGRMTSNESQFSGDAVPTATSAEFIEGAMDALGQSFDDLAQVSVENIVLDPLSIAGADTAKGLDGFPINFSPTPLLSGSLLVNLIELAAAATINGRTVNLDPAKGAGGYRVDVYIQTDALYYQGSASLAADGTWSLANVGAGTVIAFLMPVGSQQPAPGSYTSAVTGWIAHTNMGVGAKVRDYFIRVNAKTDIEYLQEDNIPLIVQDSVHARFGTSHAIAAGTPVAHVIYNDPVLGEIDLYSTLQNDAVYSDLPRAIEVPPGDPDYEDAIGLTSSKAAPIQNRCWIYSAAMAMITFTVAGLWDMAARIVTRLNSVRENPGYLPSLVLEDAEDGSTARWTLGSGSGTIANIFDSTEPPPSSSGSNVIQFTATTAPAVWNFAGSGLPDGTDSLAQWKFKSGADFSFTIGTTTSTGKVTSFIFSTAGTAGYNAGAGTLTVILPLVVDVWQTETPDLNSLLAQYVAGETLTSITSFSVTLNAAGTLNFDNLSVGAPQPAGSLSFSYDVYNGQVDQAYIRAGSVAWVAYAYGIYMQRTGDFERAALGLQDMLNFLFTLQSTASDLTQNLITLGWGKYQDPGYQYVPGQILKVSTEHNIDSYFAFDQAGRVLPNAAQTLLAKGSITQAQYNSLMATASSATAKSLEIKDAILNQLWIPASGNAKGHFAQGASSSGLDTSYALDASGTWAALFCHEVGDDSKAASCLEFIFETFFLTHQEILLDSTPNAYNEAYEQLTPFDGFKTYADSTGGYSGSPESVWSEGTWGAIAAYLRLADNADLQSYFSTAYTGGLASFTADLIASMKTVIDTAGDGVLAFSLAARGLPWEFSVRKMVASTAWFWLTGDGNDVLFTTGNVQFGKRPYLKVPQGVEQSVRQLDGQSSIGALEIEVVDIEGYATALVSGGKLEGHKAALLVGYPGMDSTDFVTVATQQIDSINVLPDATGFKLECRDLKRSAKTKIFTTGDDGFPVSKNHPRTLTANPMDVALMVLQNELGVGQSDLVPESAWKIYDPAQWDAANTSNPTLLQPNPYIDLDTFLAYRNGIFAGYLFDFTFTQSVEAKQFMEFEIFKTLGGYWITLADGRVSPRLFFPPYSFGSLATLDQRTLTALPAVTRNPIINQVTFRMDYDGSGFQTELNFAYAPSLQQFDLQGIQIIESKGMKLDRGGAALAGLTAGRIFRRYGGIDPVSGKATGGAPIYQVESQFMTLAIEVGDFIFLSHPLLPDFKTGRRGVFDRIVEVVEKQPNYTSGKMTYKLLDTGWLATKQLSLVAPAGTPSWPSASASQQGQYMFVSDSTTEEYSDGTAGKTIW
jgi:hypothetical protein